MNTAVPGGAVWPLWVADDYRRQAVAWARPPGAGNPDVAATWAAALEHEARGVLNLVVIASRCAERSADEGEREQWRGEVDRAWGRLERLYEAGLPRDFPKEPAL